MKIYNKLFNICIIVLILLLSISPIVRAGLADFTDEDAQKQTEELIKEQEEHNTTEVKSSDNYLQDLQIEGYTIEPSFDKQTLEYTIKEDVTSNEINIKAEPSNENATINGNGVIKLENDKNEYRIEVTSESGAVRTYIIKLNKTQNDETITSNTVEEIKKDEIQLKNNDKIDTNNNSNMVFIIVGIIIILIIGLMVLLQKNKKNNKHKSKH